MSRCHIYGCNSSARYEYESEEGLIQTCGRHTPKADPRLIAGSAAGGGAD